LFKDLSPILFTIFQIVWSYIWATKHLDIRKAKNYSMNRTLADTNNRYKLLSFFLFAAQNIISIASLWSNSEVLLKIHDNDTIRLLGAAIIVAATALYFRSLSYLGRNYSPCYDSHVPHEIVASGPYRFVRHPMYFAKLLLGFGTFVLSGSLWFVPQFLYLAVDMRRSIHNEEKYLAASFPGYMSYCRRTKMLVPFIL
jgi:protein-S-isoprenylcysteine O-methyltransferase Ste14